jgi:hypothetical protein
MLNPLKIQTNGHGDILNDSLKAFFNHIGDNKNPNPFSEQSLGQSSSGNPNTLSSGKRYSIFLL